jgi:hypothetical protein
LKLYQRWVLGKYELKVLLHPVRDLCLRRRKLDQKSWTGASDAMYWRASLAQKRRWNARLAGLKAPLLIQPKRMRTGCPISSAFCAEDVGKHDANLSGRISNSNLGPARPNPSFLQGN